MTNAPVLNSKRVLVVEDVTLIAFDIKEILETVGCTIIGPVPTVAEALRLVGTESIDCAVLDVNLNGEFIHPVASALRERQIPFLLTTGYDDLEILPELDVYPRLAKPFSGEELQTALAKSLKEAA